jgi:DNA/RNA endonuclease G (NUC1)
MKDTFVYSNAVPQVGDGFNSGTWSRFEAQVKRLVEPPKDGPIKDPPYNEIYVITGPIYQQAGGGRKDIEKGDNPCGNAIKFPRKLPLAICGGERIAPRQSKPNTDCTADAVAVPAALYKIVYFPDTGRYNAFILPNESHTGKKKRGESQADYLDRWQVTIDLIEEYTGYNFFPGLTVREEHVHEDSCASYIRR